MEAQKAQKAAEDYKKKLEVMQNRAEKRKEDMQTMFTLQPVNSKKHPLHVKM